jgi:hypothetical protein
MKSLQESLFDKDLVERDVPVDFDTLRDMLFGFGRRKARFFDNAGVTYHEGRQSIYLKKFIGENDCLCFKLVFSVTNFLGGAEFNTPILKTHDRWESAVVLGSGAWKPSATDTNATWRFINKKVKLDNEYDMHDYKSVIKGTPDNIKKIFNLYEGMVREFCSKDFEKRLIDLEKKFDEKHAIPGLVLDNLMKELIQKA